MRFRFGMCAIVLAVSVTAAVAESVSAIDTAQDRQIAFVSYRDGNGEIYVIGAAGGEAVNLTRHPASDTSPTWSPDGSRIAFVSDRDENPDIWVMDSDGGNAVNLSASPEHESGPVWSPDGSRIAYSASLEVELPDGSFEEALASSIFVMDLSTGRTVRLTDPDPDPEVPQLPDDRVAQSADDAQPTWSPDATLIAFVRTYRHLAPTAWSDLTAFHIVSADGSKPATFLAFGSYAVAGSHWSPDGASIVWGAVSSHNLSRRLQRLTVATGVQSDIDIPLESMRYTMPALSSDGTELAFAASTVNQELADVYVWRPEGSEPPRRLTTNPAWDTEPAWAPWYPPVGLVDTASGWWTLRQAAVETGFYFGNPGDYPFVGDWDCDGVDTPGLYRQSDGFVYLRNHNTQGIADVSFFFGNPGDIPLAGDFNADGCDTVSIYRPSEARFYIINELGQNGGGLGAAEHSFLFGDAGDKPVVGDWDGDGIDEIGLHRESSGFFYYRNTLATGTADGQFYFGSPGDRFIAGDWGGIGDQDTPAVFRPSDMTFYFRDTLTQGVADSQFTWAGAGEAWLPVTGAFGLD